MIQQHPYAFAFIIACIIVAAFLLGMFIHRLLLETKEGYTFYIPSTEVVGFAYYLHTCYRPMASLNSKQLHTAWLAYTKQRVMPPPPAKQGGES